MKSDVPEVKILAAESIKLLSQHPENPKMMAQDRDLVPALCSSSNSEEPKLEQLIADILVQLSEYLTKDQRDHFRMNISLNDALSLKKKRQGSSRKKKRNVVFIVEPMNTESAKQQLKKLILSTKGTISYTISAPDSKVHVYTRTKTERFLDLFSRAGFKARVISDAVCETEYKTVDENGDKENQLPKENIKYIEPEKQKSEIVKNRRAVVSCGDSLQARMQERRKNRIQEKETQKSQVQEEGAGVGGFISKLTSVFW